MNSQVNWQGNKTNLNNIHAWPKYLTSMLIEVLHYSLMFWNILDASMFHLLAEMNDSMAFMNCQEGKEANQIHASRKL